MAAVTRNVRCPAPCQVGGPRGNMEGYGDEQEVALRCDRGDRMCTVSL